MRYYLCKNCKRKYTKDIFCEEKCKTEFFSKAGNIPIFSDNRRKKFRDLIKELKESTIFPRK